MIPGSAETGVVVIGAGVAGCAAAITLRQAGIEVTLVDKASGSPQRFCGEFVSGEALDSLDELGVSGQVASMGPTRVRRLRMHTMAGCRYELLLGREGLGLSRRALDSTLLRRAVELGARPMMGARVLAIDGNEESGYRVRVTGESESQQTVIHSKAVIGAYGKRSAIDRILGRNFVRQSNPYIGVKCHFRGAARVDRVELYLFRGGYCGVVGVERGKTNVCLLATRKALQRSSGSPVGLLETVGRDNADFARRMSEAEPVEGTLMVISQIPFRPKRQVVNEVFMAGDSAGVMPPFLGIGVAAALRSGWACGEVTGRWVRRELDFDGARGIYETWWRQGFGTSQKWGNVASRLLCRRAAGSAVVKGLNLFPRLGDLYYRRTRILMPAMGLRDGPPLARGAALDSR